MGGLLYKEFVSVNRMGKLRLTWIMAIMTLVFIVLRIAFPGSREMQDYMVTNEDGSVINILDAFFIMFYASFIIMPMSYLGAGKIMSDDEKNNTRNYLGSLPIDQDIYIASKYVFIGISAYIFLSWEYICGITCTAFCREGILQDIAAMLNFLALDIMCIVLLLAAIGLPLYISIGREKAMRVMVVFWTVIALIAIGFLMFGDLSLISGWDITVFMDYLEDHKSGVLIFQMLVPLIVLGLYYASYKIACRLYRNREDR